MARSDALIEAQLKYEEKRKEMSTSLRIPKDLRDRLKARAESEGVTMIELIEKLLGEK